MASLINRVFGCFYIGLYTFLAIFLFTISSASLAGPFVEGNKKNGNVLHGENSSCHDSIPNGKGDIFDEYEKIKSSRPCIHG